MNSQYHVRVFSIILFLAAFTPYQKLLHTLLSPLGAIASFVLVSVESILFILFLVLLALGIRAGDRLVRTPLDGLLLLFAGSIILSIVANHQYTNGTLNGLRVLLRYISLYYIVVNLKISEQEILMVQKIIMFSGIFSGALAIVLFFIPQLNRMILPRAIVLGEFSKDAAALKTGAVAGTFSVPSEAASFLLLALISFMVFMRAKPGWYNRIGLRVIGPGLIIFGIFATYLRAALLLVPVVLALFIWFNRETRRPTTLLILICLGVFLALDLMPLIVGQNSILTNTLSAYAAPLRVYKNDIDLAHFLLQIFTPGYWKLIFTHQRGWAIITVGGHMLTSGKIFGYGPDPRLTGLAIGAQSPELAFIYLYKSWRDLYWIAMLSSYGLVGTGLFLWIIYRVYKISNWMNRDGHKLHQQLLGLLMTVYTLTFFIYSFVQPLPELKASSFFFWLLTGLVMNQYLQLGNQSNPLLKNPQQNGA